MNEAEWVNRMAEAIRTSALGKVPSLSVRTGAKIPYGFEILSYGEQAEPSAVAYETDLAIIEEDARGHWKPRVIVEAKIKSVTTHDAITYSQKAAAHKAVHPYLRYGVMLGERQHHPLPGRLYRHGVQFDFMISFSGQEPTSKEMSRFSALLLEEVEASRTLEKILYESRSRSRDHYTVLHRKLRVE